MDCAENRLAVVGEVTKERTDRPSSLTVKTRSWLVEEKEKLGFGGEFNTDG